MSEQPVIYRAEFDRIGRTHNPPPLDVPCAAATDPDGRAPDELLAAVLAYARKFCGSREVDVAATVTGDEHGGPRGIVTVGGVRNAGSFTLSRLDLAAVSSAVPGEPTEGGARDA